MLSHKIKSYTMRTNVTGRLKGLFLALILILPAQGLRAQGLDLTEVIPNDPTVRTGVLPGGSTYYIKHNAKPENRADFYIYYKVGAIQEEDSQNGLAHFLEHMAFNGTKHFEGTSMRDYLETVGIRFGENLNAGTGQEQTMYMINNVPLTREGTIDSVLLVLHDWAGFLSLDEKEIDDERGVITEEYRTISNSGRRMWEKQAPVLYRNSIYARRNVIGNPDVLANFSYDELRNFYHKWYRPDMQAFVIVGDFDAEWMERKLREVMGDITAFEVKTPKDEVLLEDNDVPGLSIEGDPELTVTSVQVLFRYPPLPEELNNRYAAYKQSYMQRLASSMFNNRMQEITEREDAPFLNAYLGYGNLVRSADALFGGAVAREGEALRAFEALSAELMRMKRYGFTQSELDRVKTNQLRSAEREYENRNDRKNGEFIRGFFSHFEEGEPYMDAETKKRVVERVLEDITLAEINAMAGAWVQDKNSAFLFSLPIKESTVMPTEDEVRAVWEKAKSAQVDAYEEGLAATELMDASSLSGSKAIRVEQGALGSTMIMLKNGIRVIVKPTEYKADEILMSSVQAGGTSRLDDLTDLYNSAIMPAYLSSTGIGEFSQTDMRKVLTGKIASAQPYVSQVTQGFSGSCSPKDLETMLQMVYLHYTAPRFNTTDWNVMMNQYRTLLPNVRTNPGFILEDSLSKIRYGHNPRSFQLFDEKVLDAVSLEGVEKVYRRFFATADEMTFTFVGNVQVEELKPLAEKYLGSLPAEKQVATYGEYSVQPVGGVLHETFKTKFEVPKVTAVQVYTGSMRHSPKENVTLSAIRYILEMRYTKYIREEKGGTYGVRVGMNYEVRPEPRFMFRMQFDTDVSKIDELLPIIQEQIDLMMSEGVSAEELTKTKEFFIKKYRDNLIQNGTWLSYLTDFYWLGTNYYRDYEKIVNELDSDGIRNAAKRAFGQGNVCTVIQYPEE